MHNNENIKKINNNNKKDIIFKMNIDCCLKIIFLKNYLHLKKNNNKKKLASFLRKR